MEISTKERQLYDSIAVGWNTWDVASHTASVLLPQRLRVNLAFIIPERGAYSRNCTRDMVESFGEHSLNGSYTDITVKYMERKWRVETSADGDELLIKVTPLSKNIRAFIALEVSNIWNGKNTVFYRDNSICATFSGENEVCEYDVKTLNSAVTLPWNPSCFHTIVVKDDQPVYFTVNSDKTVKEIDTRLLLEKSDWLKNTIHSKGDMEQALSAMRRVLLWNLVYESHHDRPVTPVTRFWCTANTAFGDYALFDWDTFFCSLLYGLIDKNLAYSTFFSILDEISPEGCVPNVGGATGPTAGRSQPQVGSLCAWKLYLQHHDKWFLEEVFPRLLKWNRWYFANRDRNHDGLLEPGTGIYPTNYDHIRKYGLVPADAEDGVSDPEWLAYRMSPMFETGLDNSPMWDRAVYNKDLYCLELSYVGGNALMVADCRLLAKIAREIGADPSVIDELTNRAASLSDNIHRGLWDAKSGCYLNRHWSGEFDPSMSPTHFYVWMTENVPSERTKQMLSHLLNENEFWGEFVLPMISKNDPSFNDQEYWRGRIWAPTNYLTFEALLADGQIEVAQELAKKGYDLFLKNWKEHGYVGENYNGITGQVSEKGDILWFSDRFYHWGALFVYIALQTTIDFDLWKDDVIVRQRPDWMEPVYHLQCGDKTVDIQ